MGTMACPMCQQVNDLVASATHADSPKEGDALICSGCGSVAVLTGIGFEVRMATEAETIQFELDPRIHQARWVVMQMRGGEEQ